MVKANEHPVHVVLRDWSKSKKTNNSVTIAETHTHKNKKRNKSMIEVEGYMCSEPWDV